MARFTMSAQLRFRDGDLYGHVNNGVHLALFENARVHFYAERSPEGTTFDQLVGTSNFSLVTFQRIEYSEPLLYQLKPIAVRLWVSRVGTTSFDLSCEVTDAEELSVFARAASGMVQVSRESGRPVPLTSAQIAWLEGFAGDPIDFRS